MTNYKLIALFLSSLLLITSCDYEKSTAHQKDFSINKSKNKEKENTQPYQDYNRKLYKHWIDEDKDCQDTIQEVLISESLIPVTFKTDKNCKVLSGKWYDPYSDRYFTDPKLLDIDHFIPLKEAHLSGAYKWDNNLKKKYANDLTKDQDTLIAVYRGANRSKGAKDPSDWMPKNKKYHCQYVKTWYGLKKKWNLEMDEKEKTFILGFIKENGCN